jgi:hypothetical protein
MAKFEIGVFATLTFADDKIKTIEAENVTVAGQIARDLAIAELAHDPRHFDIEVRCISWTEDGEAFDLVLPAEEPI